MNIYLNHKAREDDEDKLVCETQQPMETRREKFGKKIQKKRCPDPPRKWTPHEEEALAQA